MTLAWFSLSIVLSFLTSSAHQKSLAEISKAGAKSDAGKLQHINPYSFNLADLSVSV